MADTVAGGPPLDKTAAVTATESDPQTSSTAPRAAEFSQSEKLADLIARATAAYAIKDYAPATDLYSQATELQVEMNGEMSLENADLLYSYGKCLYFVAVSNSDVLGGTAAGAKIESSNPEKKVTKKRKLNGKPSTASTVSSKDVRQEVIAPTSLAEIIANGAADVIPEADLKPDPAAKTKEDTSKPYFQFDGDDKDWGESEEDEGEEQVAHKAEVNNDAEEEEDEDDFANAYEILDTARVLFLRKLDATLEADRHSTLEGPSKSKWAPSTDMNPKVRDIRERLADVHDLQAEISLEGEKFESAATELEAALALKEELYPLESAVLAECHYKLSLALEFGSMKQSFDENGNPKDSGTVDQELRERAAMQMEKAIASCKARIQKELIVLGKSLGQSHAEMEKKRMNIADVREMVSDMELRLVELRKPPVTVKEAEKAEENSALSGILGQILAEGNSEEERKRLLDEAARGAKDLSKLVKKKKAKGAESVSEVSASATPEPSAIAAAAAARNGSFSPSKRKVEFADEVEEVGREKKARVEDADEAEQRLGRMTAPSR